MCYVVSLLNNGEFVIAEKVIMEAFSFMLCNKSKKKLVYPSVYKHIMAS